MLPGSTRMSLPSRTAPCRWQRDVQFTVHTACTDFSPALAGASSATATPSGDACAPNPSADATVMAPTPLMNVRRVSFPSRMKYSGAASAGEAQCPFGFPMVSSLVLLTRLAFAA